MHTQSNRLRAALVLSLVSAMVLMGFLVTVPSARADHDTIPWSSYMNVADQSGSNIHNGYSYVLADGKGYFYVFYLKDNTGTGVVSLWVQKWMDRGPLGLPALVSGSTVQVNPGATQPAFGALIFGIPTPYATMDHTGNIYVTWASSSWSVYVSKSTDGGKTWPLAAKASPTSANALFDLPSVAVAPNGTIYAAYHQIFVSGGNLFQNVTLSWSTDGGNTYVGFKNISGQPRPTSAYFWNENIAVDAGGRFYLAYSELSFPSGLLYANWTWSDNGVAWQPPSQLNGGVAQALYPSIRVYGESVHLAWIDYRRAPNGAPTIYYMRSDNRGASWTIPTPVSQGGAAPNDVVQVTSEGSTVLVAWAGSSGGYGLSYAISADGGNVFYPEQFWDFGADTRYPATTVDENGTVYVGLTVSGGAYLTTGVAFWDGPPSAPTITGIARGTSSLTVSWSASQEKDVMEYRVWRSADGTTFQLVATVSSSTLSYADTGLANGTYWYEVTAVDMRGTSSHPSVPSSSTVGMTTQEMIDALNAEIASLQAQVTSLQGQLADANASLSAQLTAAQNQITILQNQLTALQNTANANQAALQNLQNQLTSLRGNVTNLQNALNQARTEQATQTMSYVNLGFEILVVVLLGLILVMQMRRPRPPAPMTRPMQGMQAPPKGPEDDL